LWRSFPPRIPAWLSRNVNERGLFDKTIQKKPRNDTVICRYGFPLRKYQINNRQEMKFVSGYGEEEEERQREK
jgi:hypothetical protein